MSEEIYRLDYAVYDRQMGVFCNALEAFITGFREYNATELSMDLQSLCFKASRLCALVDMDVVAQSEDITGKRFKANIQYHDELERIVNGQLSQLVSAIVDDLKQGSALRGEKLPRFKGNFADMLPHLGHLLEEANGVRSPFASMTDEVDAIQKEIDKEKKKVPQTGEKPILRFWHLCELYVFSSYIYYQFKHLVHNKVENLPSEELERIFVVAVHDYADSAEGRMTLDTFRSRLLFDNEGAPLDKEQLREKGRELVRDIPEKLQLCYMNYRNAVGKMAEEVIRLKPSPGELYALAAAVAKWEMLSSMIYEIDHPKKVALLNNTIFRSELYGKPVDLGDLRERIARMAALVDKKNQWFCVWCVLKHFNLLADARYEKFATQMMHKDWFGNGKYPTFKGENISDYSDYFGDTDFHRWNFSHFASYRALHGKPEKKWSDTLFNNFHHLCYDMEEAFRGE